MLSFLTLLSVYFSLSFILSRTLALELSAADIFPSPVLATISNETRCSLRCFDGCLRNQSFSHCKNYCHAIVGKTKGSISELSVFQNQSVNFAQAEPLSLCAPNTFDTGIDENSFGTETYRGSVDAVYLDSHRLQVRFSPVESTGVLFLEVSENSVFKVVGLSRGKRGSIVYHTPDLCRDYYVRLLFLTNNSTVLVSNVTKSGPLPELRLDTVALDQLKYDNQSDVIVAKLSWNHPFEFNASDIQMYFGYIHVIDCRLPEGFDPAPRPIKGTDGGAMTAVFPAKFAEFNCKFLAEVTAVTTCGLKTPEPGNQMIELSCLNVQNLTCSISGQKPVCAPWIHLLPSVSANGQFQLGVQWPQSGSGAPLYYHVRWGQISKQRFFPHHDHHHPPSSTSHSHSHSNSHSNSVEVQSDVKGQSAKFNEKRRRRKRFPEWKGLNGHNGQGFWPPGFPSFGHGPPHRGPPPFFLGMPSPPPLAFNDDGIWQIERETDQQFKVDRNKTSTILAGVNLTTDYGVQVCGIYNSEFKHVKWPLERVFAFHCSTNASTNSSVCNLLDESGRSKALFAGSLVPVSGFVVPSTNISFNATTVGSFLTPVPTPSSSSEETSNPAIVLQPQRLRAMPHSDDPKPISLADLERMPATIETIRNFSQETLNLSTADGGKAIRICWQMPEGLTTEQVKSYDITLDSSAEQCSAKAPCCDFARQRRYMPSPPNSCSVNILFPFDVSRIGCVFIAKVLTTAVNGGSSQSWETIQVDIDQSTSAKLEMDRSSIDLESNSSEGIVEDGSTSSASSSSSAPASSASSSTSHEDVTEAAAGGASFGAPDVETGTDPELHWPMGTNEGHKVRLLAAHDILDSCRMRLNCSHECNATTCLCPDAMLLDRNGKTCHSCRKLFGCTHFCDKTGACSCPNSMKLQSGGKSCQATETTTSHHVTGSDVINFDELLMPAMRCVQYLRWQQTESDVRIESVTDSGVGFFGSKSFVDLEVQWNSTALKTLGLDTVLLRWGPATINDKRLVNVIQIVKLTGSVDNASIPANSSRIVISNVPNSQGYGLQMCAVNSSSSQSSSSIDTWDTVPVNLLKAAPSSFGKPGSSMSDEDAINRDTLVIATVVPLLTLILLASLCGLLFYLHSERLKNYCSNFFARQHQQRLAPSPPNSVNSDGSGTGSASQIGFGFQSAKAMDNPDYQMVLAAQLHTTHSHSHLTPALTNNANKNSRTFSLLPLHRFGAGAIVKTERAVTFNRKPT